VLAKSGTNRPVPCPPDCDRPAGAIDEAGVDGPKHGAAPARVNKGQGAASRPASGPLRPQPWPMQLARQAVRPGEPLQICHRSITNRRPSAIHQGTPAAAEAIPSAFRARLFALIASLAVAGQRLGVAIARLFRRVPECAARFPGEPGQ
jgi:hypothetical protein